MNDKQHAYFLIGEAHVTLTGSIKVMDENGSVREELDLADGDERTIPLKITGALKADEIVRITFGLDVTAPFCPGGEPEQVN